MLAHRDGARLLATFHRPSEEVTASFEDLVAALIAAGVPAATAVIAVDSMLAYVNGYTIEEQARKIDALPRERRDRDFRAGLELIVAGVATTSHPVPGDPPA